MMETDGYEPLVKAHLRPTPRVKESLRLIKTNAVTAMIDISDGLAKEIHHLCAQSNVGALIEEENLPISPLVHRLAKLLGSSAKNWALFGGEDYEILFTVQPSKFDSLKKTLGKSFSVIGEVREKKFGIALLKPDGKLEPLAAKGWNHFVRRTKLKNSEAFETS